MQKMKKEVSPVPKHQALKWNVIDQALSMFLKAELVNHFGLKSKQDMLESVLLDLCLTVHHQCR